MTGLYIHIPFCLQKCRYCDFVSIPCGDALFEPYVNATIREMEQYRGVQIDTVFIGGGTPTILLASLLERLLAAVRQTFCCAVDTEWSIEANPKTLTMEKLKVLKDGGVNRLSIGVQSFQDAELKMLGRIHTAEDVYNTIELAKTAGFSNINLDLMFALPGQTRVSFLDTLKQAVSCDPTHLSCYSLILEEGTPLAQDYDRGLLVVPDEDAYRVLYEDTITTLSRKGFTQYEISNFAKPGYACRHNIKYWDCEPYIGIGAAAHSYWDGMRFSNTSDIQAYIAGKNVTEEQIALTEADRISEFMIMGFRKTAGILEAEFLRRFGAPVEQYFKKQIRRFVAGGFLEQKDGKIYLSPKGVPVCNGVLCEFILDEMKNQ